MTDLKQLAQNLRSYNAWRRGDDENANIEMPHPRDLGTWIDSAIAVVEAHAECNPLARRVERLAAERDALAVPARKLTDAVDDLAQHIRQIYGNHSMGAVDLAESIAEWADRYLKGEGE